MVSLGWARCLAAAHVTTRQPAPAFVTTRLARRGAIALAPRAKKLDFRQEQQELAVLGYSGLVFMFVFTTAATAITLYMAIQGGFQDLKGTIADLKVDLKADIADVKADIKANTTRLDTLNSSFSGLASQVTRLDKDVDIVLLQEE